MDGWYTTICLNSTLFAAFFVVCLWRVGVDVRGWCLWLVAFGIGGGWGDEDERVGFLVLCSVCES